MASFILLGEVLLQFRLVDLLQFPERRMGIFLFDVSSNLFFEALKVLYDFVLCLIIVQTINSKVFAFFRNLSGI
jgi:hypothetical protein